VAVYKTSNSGLLTRREYTSFLAGNDQFVPNYAVGAYDSIATTTLGTATASVTFSSIPATYTHLQIRFLARTNRADVNDNVTIYYNSDTSQNNYTYHDFGGDGSGIFQYGTGAPTVNQMHSGTGATAAANNFGVGITDVLDYTNANKNKVLRNLGGVDNNGSGRVAMTSGMWLNTNAITSITLTPSVGTTFTQYSSFALYGIKGA
jgi:hypothetical protein